MIVKHRASGKIGEIPDDKFDPTLFEKAADPRVKPATSGMNISNPEFGGQPEVQPKKGGLFGNLKDMGKAFVDTVLPASKNIAQDIGVSLGIQSKDSVAAQQSMKEAQDMNRKLVEVAAKEKDPQTKARMLKLSRESSANLEKANDIVTPQFSEDLNKNVVERGVAAGAEIAPLIMNPTAKGKTALQRTLSMAKQGAAASGLRTAASTKDMTAEERLTNSLVDAGWGGLFTGGIQAGGEILKKISGKTSTVGTNIKQKGSDIRQTVRKIKQPAGVWSSQKEDTINTALDELKIGGTAEEQYKKLAPAYDKLTEDISLYLDEKSVPLKSTDIVDQVNASLSDIPGDVLSDAQGLKEFEKISKEINKTAKDSEGLFEVKKWLNGRLGRVYDKVEKGNPLSPAEEVILQARDTVDQAITKLHPEIKQLTLTQSYLRDAAPSLARARQVVPTTRIAGTTVPVGVSQKATDIAGAGIQKVGSAIEKAGQGGESALGFAAPTLKNAQTVVNKFSPAVIGGFRSEDVGNMPQDTQSTETQTNQDNQGVGVQGESDHTNTIPKTATGFTVEQHLQALSQATAAGDKNAVKEIKAQLAIEQDYQKETGGSAKPLSGANSVLLNKAKTAESAVGRIESSLFNKSGKLESGKLWSKKLNPLSQSGRQLGSDIVSAIDILGFFRTGAAITADQRKDYIYMFPNELDNAETVKKKLDALKTEFSGYIQGIGSAGGAELQNQVGGFTQ